MTASAIAARLLTSVATSEKGINTIIYIILGTLLILSIFLGIIAPPEAKEEEIYQIAINEIKQTGVDGDINFGTVKTIYLLHYFEFPENAQQISELFALQTKESSYEILPTDNISELVNTLKNVSHYSHIIIDISCFKQSESEIEKALFLLKSINATPLIILARGRPRGDPFLFNLVELKLYNFVNAVDPITAKQQVEACLIGKTLQDVEHFLPTIQQKEKRSWFSRKPEKKAAPPYQLLLQVFVRELAQPHKLCAL